MAIMLAMVPLGGKAKFSVDDMRRTMVVRWPELASPEPAEKRDKTVSFHAGPGDVILGYMPGPIPWSDLERPCATSVLWPSAAKTLKKHSTHLIVAASGELKPLALSRLLTQATASVLSVCDAALGVYWCNATLVIPKGMFIDFAAKVLPLGPPLDIWVDFRVGRNKKGKSAGFTTGMVALGHMEFETLNSPEPPGELRERLQGLAGYVLEHGAVIRDGDTVGEDERERIRVVYADSAFGDEKQVMRLDYEEISP
jgi:hypothetical protein